MSEPIRTPRGPGWREWPATVGAPLPRWARRFLFMVTDEVAILVVSSVDNVIERGATWHVSISRMVRQGYRYVPQHAPDEDVALALDALRMTGSEEDNHARVDGRAGVARHFWREVDPAKRTDCECKETEETIVEPDGYTFTRERAR